MNDLCVCIKQISLYVPLYVRTLFDTCVYSYVPYCSSDAWSGTYRARREGNHWI